MKALAPGQLLLVSAGDEVCPPASCPDLATSFSASIRQMLGTTVVPESSKVKL